MTTSDFYHHPYTNLAIHKRISARQSDHFKTRNSNPPSSQGRRLADAICDNIADFSDSAIGICNKRRVHYQWLSALRNDASVGNRSRSKCVNPFSESHVTGSLLRCLEGFVLVSALQTMFCAFFNGRLLSQDGEKLSLIWVGKRNGLVQEVLVGPLGCFVAAVVVRNVMLEIKCSSFFVGLFSVLRNGSVTLVQQEKIVNQFYV
ncbi:hypothetical protein CEXT_672381 [Caerostris extrusa]|uniref:Uncharacterized protein n=1 Tax=Caerostris extrusa TaxID=172846 RepID=A0AAV4P3S9_CAEEX|nr:hypothetical protein CEXT_672381 [Caerostris extrusa]